MPFAAIPDTAALARAIVDTVRDPLLVLDQELLIVAASRAFYQTFQLVDQDIRGHPIYEIEDGQWNIPELRTILETIARDQATVEGYEVDRDFPRVGRRIMLLNARKVFYAEAGHTTTLLAFEDVTDRRAVEERVQELLQGEGHAAARNAAPCRQQPSDYCKYPAHEGANGSVGGNAPAIGRCASARSVGCRRATAFANYRSRRADHDWQLS